MFLYQKLIVVLYHTCSKKAVKKRNNKHIENMTL